MACALGNLDSGAAATQYNGVPAACQQSSARGSRSCGSALDRAVPPDTPWPAVRPCSQPPGGLASSSTSFLLSREWATQLLRSSAPRTPYRAGRSRSPWRVRASSEGAIVAAAHACQARTAARCPLERKKAGDWLPRELGC